MSEPKLPADSSPLIREQAINLIISSIAMEEISLERLTVQHHRKM